MKKNILFIVCPPLWEKLPHAGIAYLSEYLENAGFQPAMLDLNILLFRELGKSYQKTWTVNRDYIQPAFVNDCYLKFPGIFADLLQRISNESYEYAAFSVYRSNRAFCVRTSGFLKKNIPGLKIIFGGPEVFTMKEEGFTGNDAVDYFVVGEGEKPLLSILTGDDPKKISEDQLDELTFFPKYRAFDLNQYGKATLPVVSSRGCINQCEFCTERLLFKGYRFRNPENILSEIRFHYEKNKTRHFIFYDSLLNGNLKNLEDFLDLLLHSGLKIKWEAQIAVRNDMSDSLIRKFKESGCVNLFIGLESGSDTVLKKMRKRFTVYEALCFMDRLNQAGLQYEVSLIAHYPGETEGEFTQTLEFLRTNSTVIKKIAQVSLFRNYPGLNVELPVGYNETEGIYKIEKIIQVLKEKQIPYTPSYINNLI